uniref:Uncharacterized protein n=1 Tax=Knipowitschia caucasica TaxID=637954 RepID=A0AAV2LYV9_KNICA
MSERHTAVNRTDCGGCTVTGNWKTEPHPRQAAWLACKELLQRNRDSKKLFLRTTSSGRHLWSANFKVMLQAEAELSATCCQWGYGYN